MRGRVIQLSLPQRTVVDLLYFAAAVPTVPVQRQMSLGPVIAARAACRDRPRWTAIFAKAYALTAREFPEVRRAYLKFPWPILYEYPTSNANIVIERDYEGEPSLFSMIIKDPAGQSLRELGQALQYASTAPIDEVKDFRRSMRIASFPRPLRRLVWSIGLNIGRQRANYFGTFALSVYSALNAESLHPITPLTTLLNYGVISSDGSVAVRVIYDHRTLNGATVARVLARLEEILNSVVADELRSMVEKNGLQTDLRACLEGAPSL
jgi:hypothetical protein